MSCFRKQILGNFDYSYYIKYSHKVKNYGAACVAHCESFHLLIISTNAAYHLFKHTSRPYPVVMNDFCMRLSLVAMAKTAHLLLRCATYQASLEMSHRPPPEFQLL